MCNFALAFFTITSIGKCRVDGWGAYTEKAFINALFFDCSKSRKL